MLFSKIKLLYLRFSSHPKFSLKYLKENHHKFLFTIKMIVASKTIQFLEIKYKFCLLFSLMDFRPITLWIQRSPRGFEVYYQKLTIQVLFHKIKHRVCFLQVFATFINYQGLDKYITLFILLGLCLREKSLDNLPQTCHFIEISKILHGDIRQQFFLVQQLAIV